MTSRINTFKETRDIRSGVQEETKIDSEIPFRNKIQNLFQNVGNAVTLGNILKLSPIELRRIGAPVVAAIATLALVPGTPVAIDAGKSAIHGLNYEFGTSTIPGSKNTFDPKVDVLRPIPSDGALNFAATVDPNHNPQMGEDEFRQQLHHDPVPGDMVVVPRNTK
jgi:hypothetical protein